MRKKLKEKKLKNVLDFISEAGMLKQVQRSGWSVLGIKNAESVADHSFRCAVIGYVLAHMEGADPYRVFLMTLFNDIHESRIFDLHKMAQRYIDGKAAENRSFSEQIGSLPKAMKDELAGAREEYNRQKTKEGVIARDADVLECLIQAREYQCYGFREAVKFMKKAPRFLKTKSAKALWKMARVIDPNDWWFKLSTFTR